MTSFHKTYRRPLGTFYLKNQISISKTSYICGPYFHLGNYGNKKSIEYEQMGFRKHAGCEFSSAPWC